MYPHITDPERLLNLVYYMAGQEVFNDLEIFNDDEKWNGEITNKDIEIIIEELKAMTF